MLQKSLNLNFFLFCFQLINDCMYLFWLSTFERKLDWKIIKTKLSDQPESLSSKTCGLTNLSISIFMIDVFSNSKLYVSYHKYSITQINHWTACCAWFVLLWWSPVTLIEPTWIFVRSIDVHTQKNRKHKKKSDYQHTSFSKVSLLHLQIVQVSHIWVEKLNTLFVLWLHYNHFTLASNTDYIIDSLTVYLFFVHKWRWLE